jgi:hypothetical protein
MALLKNQTGKGTGIGIEITGIEELVKTLGEFPSIQNKAFKEAAKIIGKQMESQARSNLQGSLDKPKKISVRELSDKAREQIANGTFTMRAKLDKKEKDEIYYQELKQREREGKPGKPRKKHYKIVPVKVADYALPKKYSNQFFPLTGAIVDNAKTNVYGRTGNLLKSIKFKIWSPKAKGNGKRGKNFRRPASGVVVVLVGPTRIVGMAYNTMAKKFQTTNTFKYAHLVDRGHRKIIMGHKTQGFVPGNKFLSSIAENKSLVSQVNSVAREVLLKHINGPEFAKRSAARRGK